MARTGSSEQVLWSGVWTPGPDDEIPESGDSIFVRAAGIHAIDIYATVQWCDPRPDGKYAFAALVAKEDEPKLRAALGHSMFEAGRVRKVLVGWRVDGRWCPTRNARDREMRKAGLR